MIPNEVKAGFIQLEILARLHKELVMKIREAADKLESDGMDPIFLHDMAAAAIGTLDILERQSKEAYDVLSDQNKDEITMIFFEKDYLK